MHALRLNYFYSCIISFFFKRASDFQVVSLWGQQRHVTVCFNSVAYLHAYKTTRKHKYQFFRLTNKILLNLISILSQNLPIYTRRKKREEREEKQQQQENGLLGFHPPGPSQATCFIESRLKVLSRLLFH